MKCVACKKNEAKYMYWHNMEYAVYRLDGKTEIGGNGIMKGIQEPFCAECIENETGWLDNCKHCDNEIEAKHNGQCPEEECQIMELLS